MDRHFYVRTTMTISRDFIARCADQTAAEKIAEDLMTERVPQLKEGEAIQTIRNEKDSNFSVSEASDDCKDDRSLPLPDFLAPLWQKHLDK